jgi:hypothetical protein
VRDFHVNATGSKKYSDYTKPAAKTASTATATKSTPATPQTIKVETEPPIINFEKEMDDLDVLFLSQASHDILNASQKESDTNTSQTDTTQNATDANHMENDPNNNESQDKSDNGEHNSKEEAKINTK